MTIILFILCGIAGLVAGLLAGELCVRLAALRRGRKAVPAAPADPNPVPVAR